jgi:hypothetical protein
LKNNISREDTKNKLAQKKGGGYFDDVDVSD